MPLALTGLGLVSPLGQSAWATFRALLAGQTLADRLPALEQITDPVHLVRAVGCVKAVQHAGIDPAVALAELAAREACAEARIDPRGLPCFVGSSKGAITAWSTTAATVHAGRPLDALTLEGVGPHDLLNRQLTRRLGVRVHHHAVAACASSLVAFDAARRFLQRGTAHDAVLVVTSEAALTDLFIHAYRRLGVLAPLDPITDYRGGSLGDEAQRQGFTLGEQAAAVVLRRLDETDAPPRCELLHTATASDPHDLIRADPDLPAVRRLLDEAQRHTPLAVVHPHAPGTPDHDPAERAAITAACPDATLGYACKAALGHGLGASGLVALVLTALAARARQRPPMPWLGEHQPVPLPPGPHAVLAAGFAGHTALATIQHTPAPSA